VLAEAATAFAGMARMPIGRFIAMAGLASVGVSAVYAFVGAYAAEAESFVLAFAGAVLVPLGPMLWLRRQDRARPRVNSSADACAP
jgi:3-dehydroquinate synthase